MRDDSMPCSMAPRQSVPPPEGYGHGKQLGEGQERARDQANKEHTSVTSDAGFTRQDASQVQGAVVSSFVKADASVEDTKCWRPRIP